MTSQLRIGLIGAGANTRNRHIPGLLAVEGVELAAVCNRRPESTAEVAREFDIPRQYARWEDLLADPNLDAVVIGTWPYLHAPITLAALAAGKHVLTEARMAMNAEEARVMLAASRQHPSLVTQIVPSPFGLHVHNTVRDLLAQGYLGSLREVSVIHRNGAFADPSAPLHWRQDAALSGLNMLTLGILHETLLRWLPQPVRVLAQVQAFVAARIDPSSGARRPVGTPDSVQVLTAWSDGACGTYQFSGATPFGQEGRITLLGSEGVLVYDLLDDSLRGMSSTRGGRPGAALEWIEVPASQARGWRVEADWVESIREGTPVRLTDFATGVAYMEFTEAVARSAREATAVQLPL